MSRHRPHPHEPKDKGAPRHGPPGDVHWFYSAREVLSLDVVSKVFTRFANALDGSQAIHLGTDAEVRPPDPCETLIRFERTPHGELVFKIELKWNSGDKPRPSESLVADVLGPTDGKDGFEADGADLPAGWGSEA